MRTYPSIHIGNYTQYPAYILVSSEYDNEALHFKEDLPSNRPKKDRTSMSFQKTVLRFDPMGFGNFYKQLLELEKKLDKYQDEYYSTHDEINKELNEIIGDLNNILDEMEEQ
jgi:hypothetical protein